jgi:ribosomal protein S18 acetylase RimI-like enzyme
MIESKVFRKNAYLSGQRIEVRAVSSSTWSQLRGDILEIENASFPPSLADSGENLRKIVDSPTGIFIVLELLGKVAGYAAADLLECFPDIPGIGTDSHFGQKDTIYVDSVAVLPHSRGRGFGMCLMRQCLEMALERGIRRATAHVQSGSGSRMKLAMNVLASFANWYGTGRTFDYVEIQPEA